MHGEVNTLEKRNRNDENKLKETLNETENINFLHNEITKEVQHNLSRINLIFTKLLAEVWIDFKSILKYDTFTCVKAFDRFNFVISERIYR